MLLPPCGGLSADRLLRLSCEPLISATRRLGEPRVRAGTSCNETLRARAPPLAFGFGATRRLPVACRSLGAFHFLGASPHNLSSLFAAACGRMCGRGPAGPGWGIGLVGPGEPGPGVVGPGAGRGSGTGGDPGRGGLLGSEAFMWFCSQKTSKDSVPPAGRLSGNDDHLTPCPSAAAPPRAILQSCDGTDPSPLPSSDRHG